MGYKITSYNLNFLKVYLFEDKNIELLNDIVVISIINKNYY
jgi:hypothetical protein